MSKEVEFFENDDSDLLRRGQSVRPVLVKWVMNTGIAKTEDQANIFLFVFAVLIFILSISIFMSIFSGNSPAPEGAQNLASFQG